jgi:hypothetical protein
MIVPNSLGRDEPMSTPSKTDFRRVYEAAAAWPVPDRLALVQMLVTTLRLDLKPGGASANPENGQQPEAPAEVVPRGVPVERILARPVPNFTDDAGIDQLRWEYLRDKYLK